MLAEPEPDSNAAESNRPAPNAERRDAPTSATTRVSVIVATYNSGPGLDGVLRSLDRQSLPQSEFEVVVVDDGSTDDTWSRLEAARDTRPNLTIQRIDNSGWPSRPRNVGLELAHGEHVIFMDHDDEIFPDGLRAACAYAQDHDLDILSAKEVKTSSAVFGFDAYRCDSYGPRADLGIMNLVPMMPHKLYRRQMLINHGVRFPEGRRVFWEDVNFNVDAFTVARRIGTMSHSPVYRRVMDKTNASRLYLPQKEEFWQKLTTVFAHIAAALEAEEFAADREQLLRYQYRSRVLTNVAKLLAHGHEKTMPMVLPHVTDIQQKWVPVSGPLPSRYRIIDELLRAGDIDALRAVSKASVRVVGTSVATSVGWDENELIVATKATWTGSPSEVKPGFLAPQSDEEQTVINAELAATESVLVEVNRASQEPTALPTTRTVEQAEAIDPLGSLTVTTETRIAAPTTPRCGVFDLQAHNSALGFTNQRGLRSKTGVRVGLIEGQALIAYANRNGLLSIDYGQSLRSVVNSADRRCAAATIVRGSGGSLTLTLPLGKVHVWGVTRLEGQLALTADRDTDAGTDETEVPDSAERFAAALIGDADGARVEAAARVGPGRYRLWFSFGGRLVASEIVLTVPRLVGRPTLSARQPAVARTVQRAVTMTKRITRSRPAP